MDSLFAAIEEQRQIVASARKQRRLPAPPPKPASKLDYSVEPEAAPVEVFPPVR